jgi:mono/diheme cytochrome c family protein
MKRLYGRHGWALLLLVILTPACAAPGGRSGTSEARAAYTPPIDENAVLYAQVLRGRGLVLSRDCGGCHVGGSNPAAEGWLAGRTDGQTVAGHVVYPRNLTPDATGIADYTDRQLFNALRFGLKPGATPDAEITSATPGVGNHPANPVYLAPAMPWIAWRYLSDEELWDIIAYLRHGVRPVHHEVPPSQTPPDGWAGAYAPEYTAPYPLPPFPTANEELRDPARRDQVLRGRGLVASAGCSDCHGGSGNPAARGWLAGVLPEAERRPGAGPFEAPFQVGPFKNYGRNLTPDNVTGIGRFSERQIFNALRYGLRPGETEDVEITGTTPGVGNFPLHPKYLAVTMPWSAWRHMPDRDLLDIAAYLKHGLKPVRNRVEPSDGPPDFWAGEYTVEKIGPYPALPFPTQNEEFRGLAGGLHP